jgi:PAS domain S-box-containing protein
VNDETGEMTPSGDDSLKGRIAELEEKLAAHGRDRLSGRTGVVVTTLDEGRIVQASESFAQLSGYAREELLGRATSELGLWRNAADRARAVERLAALGGRASMHFVIQRRDGTPCEIAAQMEMMKLGDEQCVVTFVEELAPDWMQRLVREQEESLDFILQNAPVALFTTDGDGILKTSAGSGLWRLGVRSGELVGKSALDLYATVEFRLSDGLLISVAEVLRRVLAGEVIAGRTDVSGVIFENWISPLRDPSGGIAGIVGLSLDVTDRVVLEMQLLHSRKLEALGRLAGGVAHDFNNMLSVILGFSELLLEETGADDSRRAELEEIVAAARRSSELTGQLLAFGRKQVLRPRPLDLRSMLSRLDRMLRRLIGEHIEIVTRAPDDVPCAFADEGQLEQVIVNLALNGRDAMPRGGKLQFSLGEANVAEPEARRRGLEAGRYLVLSIGDTGSGMDPETLSHIFEPFFTTKQSGQGTGLGLSTAYGFVRQSGGDIEVESARGLGTTFRIYLPATVQRARAPVDAAGGRPLMGNEVVLVAEDEAMVLHLASELLRRAGYRVIGAQSAAEALEMASADRSIDLLLTDVFLGDLPGTELAARIARAHPELRTVYMSGYQGEETPEPLLQKPFTASSLLHAVRIALDGDGEGVYTADGGQSPAAPRSPD